MLFSVSLICLLLSTMEVWLISVMDRIPSYGDAESEFWLAIGKVILAVGLICFTFISMVGGNPRRDAYGFRYWKCKHCF